MGVCRVFWMLPPELADGALATIYGTGKMMIPPANQSPDLTALERLVLETTLAGLGADCGFHQQIDAATVTARTPSGVGFMTKLSVPDELRVTGIGTVVPVIIGEHPALPSGAEFILQIKNGRLNCIEAFCHEGVWPVDESLFHIYIDQVDAR